jgi:hypothetical protein
MVIHRAKDIYFLEIETWIQITEVPQKGLVYAVSQQKFNSHEEKRYSLRPKYLLFFSTKIN